MRWIGCILLLLLVFHSCEKEKSEVSFRVKMDGFYPEGKEYGLQLKSSKDRVDYLIITSEALKEALNHCWNGKPGRDYVPTLSPWKRSVKTMMIQTYN